MQCLKPLKMQDAEQMRFAVRCGQCKPCRILEKQKWTSRMRLESMDHSCSSFLTLTYEDQHLDDPVLDYSHIQGFLKRYRKATPQKMRFFCCGEYGDKHGRKHWHLIMFGDPNRNRGLCRIAQWPYGFAFIGNVNTTTIRYCAGYAVKKLDHGSSDKKPVHQMSLKPGIGMPRLKQIGFELGMKYGGSIPEMTHLKLGSDVLPLDFRTFNALKLGFEEAGLELHRVKRCKILDDMRERFEVMSDPRGKEWLADHVEIAPNGQTHTLDVTEHLPPSLR